MKNFIISSMLLDILVRTALTFAVPDLYFTVNGKLTSSDTHRCPVGFNFVVDNIDERGLFSVKSIKGGA